MCQLFQMLGQKTGKEKRDLCSAVMNIWEACYLNGPVLKSTQDQLFL